MPTGRSKANFGIFTARPLACNAVSIFIARKLKYLKRNRIARFNTKLLTRHIFFFRFSLKYPIPSAAR